MQQPSDSSNHYKVSSISENHQNPVPTSSTLMTDFNIGSECNTQGRRLLQGQSTYALINTVRLEEAQLIEQQSGITIPFEAGKSQSKPVLGKGGFGKVRLAVQYHPNGTHTYVAVKKIKGTTAITASRHEARLQQKLVGTKGVMPLYDSVEAHSHKTGEPVLYQFMPLASMGDVERLKTHLAGLTDLSLKTLTFLQVAKEFLLGLWHLHQKHVYHLDVKPSNIMVNQQGHIYVSDFGWSIEQASDSHGRVWIQPHYQPNGQPLYGAGDGRYFSPERDQVSYPGTQHAFDAPKVDAYAAGISLWELLTGQSLGNAYAAHTQTRKAMLAHPLLHDFSLADIAILIRGLLDPNPDTRLTITAALSQPVFQLPALHDPIQLETAITFLKQFVAHTGNATTPSANSQPIGDVSRYGFNEHAAQSYYRRDKQGDSNLNQSHEENRETQRNNNQTPSAFNLASSIETPASQVRLMSRHESSPALAQALNHWLHPFSDQPDIINNQAMYVPLEASRDRQGQMVVDLEAQVQDFLRQDKKVFLLLADGGAGKSTFLQHITLSQAESYRLSQSHDNNNHPHPAMQWLPLYISLNSLTQPKAFLEEILSQRYGLTMEQISHVKNHYPLLLLLDGYDEMPHKVNLYLENKLSEWKIKLIITSRLNSLPQDYLTYFLPYDMHAQQTPYGLLDEIYVQPFSLAKIEHYIGNYLKVNVTQLEQEVQEGRLGKEWLELTTYQTYLQQIPGLTELMKTPFIARLTLETLPTLVQDYATKPQAIEKGPSADYFPLPQKLEAVDVYEVFLKQWFSRGYHKQTSMLLESDYFTFGEALASSMLTHPQGRFAVVSFEPAWRFNRSIGEFEEVPHAWSAFFSETDAKAKALRALLPLKKLDSHTYAFIHYSIAEYCYARKLYQEIMQLPDALPTSALLKLSLNQHAFFSDTAWYPLLRFLAQWVSSDSAYQQRLFHLVYSSKQEKGLAKAATHAMMILHMAGVQFNNLDFKGITIPGADLSGLVADSTDWSNSDLSHINFKGAWLRNSKFIGANLTGLRLYEYPHIEEEYVIVSCCYSPDGKWLALAGGGDDIKLYEVHTRRHVNTFKGHTSSVKSVTFSPDGKILASASRDNTLKVWDAHTGACVRSLEGHTGLGVDSVTFSPDGKSLASGSSDKTLKLWDVQTGVCLMTLEGHTGFVKSVTFSPDGKTLASCSNDGTLKLWDVQTGASVMTLEGHTRVVTNVTFSPDGKTLASSSEDKTLRLWNAQTGDCMEILAGHTDQVQGVTFSPDGKTLASASTDKTLKLWDAQTGACVMTLEGHTSFLYSVTFSPDGKTLVSSSYDLTLKFWDAQTGACVVTLTGHMGEVYSVTFSPDGRQLASASDDHTLKFWDKQTGCVKTLPGHRLGVKSVTFSPDGKQLASASSDNTLKLWDAQTGACVMTLEGQRGWGLIGMQSVIFSPDGKTLASAGGGKTLNLWDVQTGACIMTLEGHTKDVTCVSFSPDGKQLASSSSDNTLKLWDAQMGTCVMTLEGHTSFGVESVTFSSDGKTLVSSSWDDTLKLWNAQTGACVMTLTGHMNGVTSVVFSPDGKQLASGSRDKTLKFWDRQTGACLQTQALPFAVYSLSWQGQALVVGFGNAVAYFTVHGKIPTLSLRWLRVEGNALVLTRADISQAQGLSVDNAALFKQRDAVGEPLPVHANPVTVMMPISNTTAIEKNSPAATSEPKRKGAGLSLPTPSKLLQGTGLFKKKSHSGLSNLPTQQPHIKAKLSNHYQGVAMHDTYPASNHSSENLVRPILASTCAFKALHNYFIEKKQEQQKKRNKQTGYKEKLEDFRVLLTNLKQTPSAMTIQQHLNNAPSFKHNNFFKDDRYHKLREELLTLYSPQDMNSYSSYLKHVQDYYHALNNNHLEIEQAAELAVVEVILLGLNQTEKAEFKAIVK